MAEEILLEIEAVKAVYGLDCKVLQEIPPHLKVSIKPRTAEDLSQQFVEAVLVIKANAQYPMVPPELELIDLKGLDDKHHSDLMSEMQDEAKMLASSPMLVALCEAAIDRLSNMNHPEGNCSFCLFPLVMEDARSSLRPFMKLMSCFHCFHSDCFGRWWRWTQEQSHNDPYNPANTTLSESSQFNIDEDWRSVNCPVCRKVIQPEDVEHVQQFLTSESDLHENDEGSGVDDILSTEEENKRREKFAQMFKVQQDCGGIIEPKKLEVILPGMFLTGSVLAQADSTAVSNGGVPLAEEINLGGVVDPIAASSDLPSSSTSSMPSIVTEEARDCTTVEQLDVHVRGSNFGRSKNRSRRHNNRQSLHGQKQTLRQQTGAPAKAFWVKKE